MKTLKIKEQMIFFSYLKKNAGWLCLDWAAQCFQKKKKNVPFTAGCTVCFLNWSRSLKRLPFGLAWNAMPFVDEFSKNFKGKIL